MRSSNTSFVRQKGRRTKNCRLREWVVFIFLLGLIVPGNLFAQDYFSDKLGQWKLEPVVMLQFWSLYSHGAEVYQEPTGAYEPVDNRLNIQIRRGRFGFRAQPYDRLKFTVVGHFDLVGRDVLAGSVGGSNPATPKTGLWDAFFQWRVKDSSEAFHLTGGFFRPQFSRESITSGWSVTSMEKSMSQNYIRRHLVGTGPGRTMGVNLGGLLTGKSKVGLLYNVGVFSPVHSAEPGSGLTGISSGNQAGLLWVGRSVVSFGDPEQTRYKIGYDINYYNKRKGLSIGLNTAWSGQADLFEEGFAVGGDVLFNYLGYNLDAEWTHLQRSGIRDMAGSNRAFTYSTQTGHIRGSVNLVVNQRYFLEPVAMVMFFEGGKSEMEQADAKAVGAFSGSERNYEIGCNYYLNKKHLKLTLHYSWRKGDAGAAGKGATVNQYFSQSGVGAIHRGDWLGLGLNVIL